MYRLRVAYFSGRITIPCVSFDNYFMAVKWLRAYRKKAGVKEVIIFKKSLQNVN